MTMKVTLKDGSFKEYAQPMAVIDIAKDISEGLARMACVAEIDGEVKDLRTIVDKDCTLNIFTAKDPEGLAALRHTASHVMAQAIKRLWPETKLAIGPSIADGFYYDIDRDEPVTSDDLAKIEAEMKKIIKEALPLERFELPRAQAIELMKEKNEPYKVELIEDLPEDAIISFYKQGEFTDLCAGPHLMNTKEVGKAFKLMNIAGAYWRGSEKNKMLTRIYATAFAKKEDLEAYVTMMEEAKKRDHRKLGKELGLFMMSDAGPGFPFFLPKGMILKNTLLDYWREIHKKAGYVEISTPIILNRSLWETSGHWDHYKDDMFPIMKMDTEEMVLRPMNCPHHMLVYKSELRSYKDLPIKIGELANDFRYENSGAVCGLERVRQMCQNDAHLFVRPDQIKEEVGKVLKLIVEVYQKDFGFPSSSFKYRLSLRDKNNKEKYIPYNRILKSTIYDVLKNNINNTTDIIKNYGYPNINKSDVRKFICDLINLTTIELRKSPFIEEKIKLNLLLDFLRDTEGIDELIFLSDEDECVLIKQLNEFYSQNAVLFINSKHIFDNESDVQNNFSKVKMLYQDREISNYLFSDSKSNILIQASDVIIGVFGKLFSFIKSIDILSLDDVISKMNDTQIKNLDLLLTLYNKSLDRNPSFINSIESDSELKKLNALNRIRGFA